MLAALCVLLFTGLCVLLYNIRSRRLPSNVFVPETIFGKKGFPIIGHYPTVIVDILSKPLETFLRFTEQFKGKTWGLEVPIERGIMFVVSPENVQHVLKDNFSNYVKGPGFHDRLEELLGEGIFNTDGAKWRSQRKTASYLFSQNELKTYMTRTFVKHADFVVKKLSKIADTGEYVDMQEIFYQFTLDSICEIAFGINLKTLSVGDEPADEEEEEEDSKFNPIGAADGKAFAKAFDETQETIEKRFFHLTWYFMKKLWWLFPSQRLIQRNVAVLNNFASNIIRHRREEGVEALKGRSDLLSLFLSTTDSEGEPFSDEYLRDIVLNFTIAGRDTTAQALSWTHYMLSENPSARTRLHKELDTVLSGNDKKTDFDTCKELLYTEAVVCETLRLYPSVPKDPKFALKDDMLPDGCPVPAGMVVVYLPWVMGRLEHLWPNALKFTPERWLVEGNSDGKEESQHGGEEDMEEMTKTFNKQRSSSKTVSPILKESPFKFTAFQAGPRTCLGKFVALLEAKICTAAINKRFELRLKPGHPVEYRNSLTLPMKHGLLMSVHSRAD